MIIVAKFGVRKFLSGHQLAHAEMRSASRYYNALVSIERWRRQEYSAIRSRTVPGLSEIDAAYEQLDEWIGLAHEGPDGKRGAIREKRRKATAKTGVPTKRVDADAEIDVIAEMKIWRREAGALAKPLRARFLEMVATAETECTLRSHKLRIEWGTVDGDNHAKRRSDMMARDAMLAEPQWPEVWKELAQLEIAVDELKQWVKSARLLSTGTYYAVQQRDFPAACKRPKPRPDGEPIKPRARPGYSTRQLRRIGWEIKGCTWGDVLNGKSGELKIADLRDQGGGNGGRVKQRATAIIRLRSEDRIGDAMDPDYYRPSAHGDAWNVAVDMVIHRPIPLDTRVKWVYLVPEERSPGRWEYSVQLTLDPTAPLIQRAPGKGTVNVNLCWTQDGETLVVARINGEPLRLPMGGPRRGVVPSLRYAEYLRGVADKYFDAAREQVIARLPGLSNDFALACTGIAQWRASKKLRWVSEKVAPREEEMLAWKAWKDRRLSEGKDLFELDVGKYASEMGLTENIFPFWLATWRRKDEHLEAMACGARYHGMGRRRDFYRVTAARLCTEFEICEVGGAVNLAALALRDKSEDKPRELHQAARHNRQLASVHELKDALKHAFGPDRYRERSGEDEEAVSARGSVKDTGKENSEEVTDAAE